MTTDLTIANILAHMDYEFEANPSLMIYVICNRCGHDRFEICDSRQEIGPSGLTVYSLWIAELSTKLTLAKCRCQNDRRA